MLKKTIFYIFILIGIVFIGYNVKASEFTAIPNYYINGFQSGAMSSFNDGISQVYIASFENLDSTSQIYFNNLNVNSSLLTNTTYRLKFSFYYGAETNQYCSSSIYTSPNLRLYYSGGSYLANISNTNYSLDSSAVFNYQEINKCNVSWDFTVPSSQNITSMLISIAGNDITFETPNYLLLYSTYSLKEVSDDTEIEDDSSLNNEDEVYFNLDNLNYVNTYNEIKSKIDEVLEELKNRNLNNYNWVVWIGKDKTGSFVLVNLLPTTFKTDLVNYNYCSFNSFTHSNRAYLKGGCETSMATPIYTFRKSSSISSLITSLQTNFSNIPNMTSGSRVKQLSSYTGDLSNYNFENHSFDYFANNSLFILPYASSVPIYNYSNNYSMTHYKLKINDFELSSGSKDYLEPSDSYLEKKYDTYSLSSSKYSAIEVKFHIQDFPMIDEGNDINLEYEINLQNEMLLSVLPIPQEKIYRNLTLGNYDLGTTTNLLFDEKSNTYSYSGTMHYDYWNTITYRFEFPFISDYVGNVNFKFWSDSPYTINLEERNNEENDIKYTELDLTGKYGVGFIPKVLDFGVYNDFYGRFFIPMNNNYKLLFYKDYNFMNNKNNKNNLLEDRVLLSLEQFEYLFTKENKYSYLLFINNNFEKGTKATIYYNSNYFTYCILDESISVCNGNNPNTNEEINLNTNLSDVDNFKISNIFDTFLSFSDSTNFILTNVTNFYTNYLPVELRAFFYIVFGFAVIIIITKIVL